MNSNVKGDFTNKITIFSSSTTSSSDITAAPAPIDAEQHASLLPGNIYALFKQGLTHGFANDYLSLSSPLVDFFC